MQGFVVYGVDNSPEKVKLLENGQSYIGDVSEAALKECLRTGRVSFSTDYSVLTKVQAISVCVPTPLRKTKDPDMSYVVDAAENISRVLQKGQVIILESTVYPGATEELIAPILERSGFKVGKDFYLAFSPERVDPGNKQYGIRDIPKIVGGVTEACTKRANDIRESPALDIIGLLVQKGAEVSYNDPFVPSFDYFERKWGSQPLNEEFLKEQDCVIIVTDHSNYDWDFIARNAKLIFDTRNATKEVQGRFLSIHLM